MNKKIEHIYGIDETCKCPVIGSITVCVTKVHKHFFRSKSIRALPIKDSKLTTVNQRNRVFTELNKFISYSILKISPSEMNENLIDLEVKKIIEGLNNLNYKNGEVVYIDLFDSTKENIIKRFRKFGFDTDFEKWIIETRADYKYKVVSLASIFSKYYTDLEFEDIKNSYPDIGNGNPSDLKTIKFIIEHYDDLPWFIRKTWLTVKRLSNPEFRLRILNKINEKLVNNEKTIKDLYKNDEV